MRLHQVAIHAIGDRAIDETLNAYAKGQETAASAGTKHADCDDLAHRVEHVEHMAGPDTIAQFAKQGTYVVANPIFMTMANTDLEYINDGRIGPGKTFAYRSLLEVKQIDLLEFF